MKAVILFLSSLLLVKGTIYAQTKVEKDHGALANKIVEKTANRMGADKHDIRRFLDSSFRVAEIVQNFPARKKSERALKNFCYGGKESMFRKDYCHANIPGKVYPGLSGKRKYLSWFSIDYGWPGLNERNVEWTYAVAVALQSGKPIPEEYSQGLMKETREFYFKNIHIPKSLRLKKIDISTAKKAKSLWKSLKKKYKPEDIIIPVDYRERSDDDLDSILIYRLLVEIDRQVRGWTWRTWDSDLYRSLSRITVK